MGIQFVEHAPFRERRMPGQQMKPSRSERIQVAANVGGLAVASLLGRHVIDGADGRAGTRDVGLHRLIDRAGQAHVSELHESIFGDHQVRWLDVAMDDFLLMSVLQGERGLSDDVHRSLGRHRPPFRDDRVRVRPVDEFEGDVQVTVRLTGIVNGDDVVVFECGGGLSLGLEAFDERRVLRLFLGEHLQRNLPPELRVGGEEDRPHSSLTELLDDRVPAKLLQCIESMTFGRGTLARRIAGRSRVRGRGWLGCDPWLRRQSISWFGLAGPSHVASHRTPRRNETDSRKNSRCMTSGSLAWFQRFATTTKSHASELENRVKENEE